MSSLSNGLADFAKCDNFITVRLLYLKLIIEKPSQNQVEQQLIHATCIINAKQIIQQRVSIVTN